MKAQLPSVTRLLGLTVWSRQASALLRWRHSGGCGSDWTFSGCYIPPDLAWERKKAKEEKETVKEMKERWRRMRRWDTEQTWFRVCLHSSWWEWIWSFISSYRCLCMRALKAMPSFQQVVKFVMLTLGYLQNNSQRMSLTEHKGHCWEAPVLNQCLGSVLLLNMCNYEPLISVA